MKKQFTFLIIIISSLTSFAQIEFEKGYFIDNSGKRTDCLIKNLDWKNNPDKFRYKLTEDDKTEIRTIENTSEFVVGELEYYRMVVQIDRSSTKTTKLESGSAPKFKEQTVFLKLMVAGNANLYQYQEGSLIRFFFSINHSSIEPLIYKKYLVSGGNMATNNKFRSQISEALICDGITKNEANRLSYNPKSLINHFLKYNQCIDPNAEVQPEKGTNQYMVNLRIRPGAMFSDLSLINVGTIVQDVEYDQSIEYRLGLEFEYLLPFNNQKWAIIVEPIFHSYRDSARSISRNVVIDYRSIEFLIGARHYFHLSEKSRIFITGAYVLDLSLNSKIQFGTMPMDIRTPGNFNLGVGYSFNNTFDIEFKYGFQRQILEGFSQWETDYRTMGIMIGYNFLRKK